MRMTYRQLRQLLTQFHPDQLNADVTVEFPDGSDVKFGTLRILSDDNTYGLERNHPVIYIDYNQDEPRYDKSTLDEYIKSLVDDGAFGRIQKTPPPLEQSPHKGAI